MEPSSAPSSPGVHLNKETESPTGTTPRRPLPQYTTIDLENELPELTSLNPNIHDPDLCMFYNHTTFSGPPFYNYKRNVPPSYPASVTTSRTFSSSSSPKAKYEQKTERYRRILIAFFVLFVVFPFVLLLLTSLLPALRTMQTRVVE